MLCFVALVIHRPTVRIDPRDGHIVRYFAQWYEEEHHVPIEIPVCDRFG